MNALLDMQQSPAILVKKSVLRLYIYLWPCIIHKGINVSSIC